MTGTFDDATVQRRAARLSALLASADERMARAEFPAERVRQAARRGVLVRQLRVAAAAALLLVGFGVPPVRAWIAGSVHTLWARIAGPKPPVLAPSPAAPLPAAAMGAVTVPASPTFTLRVASRQAAGDLDILVHDGASVSATVSGPSAAAELTVFPDGIRIANARGASAGYQLRVPLSVSRLVVQIGTETPRIFHPGRAGDHWSVSLRAR